MIGSLRPEVGIFITTKMRIVAGRSNIVDNLIGVCRVSTEHDGSLGRIIDHCVHTVKFRHGSFDP